MSTIGYCRSAQIPLQQQSGLDHRVGAVRDHYRRGILRELLAHRREHSLAIGVRHLQAVLVHQMRHVDRGVRQPQHPEIAIDLAVQILHVAGLLGINLLDGAAGGDDIDASAWLKWPGASVASEKSDAPGSASALRAAKACECVPSHGAFASMRGISRSAAKSPFSSASGGL